MIRLKHLIIFLFCLCIIPTYLAFYKFRLFDIFQKKIQIIHKPTSFLAYHKYLSKAN